VSGEERVGRDEGGEEADATAARPTLSADRPRGQVAEAAHESARSSAPPRSGRGRCLRRRSATSRRSPALEAAVAREKVLAAGGDPREKEEGDGREGLARPSVS
jgi:hypothetical protein